MPKGIPDKGDVGDGGTFPLDIHEIRKLRGTDRSEALKLYHQWLDEQRKQDKRHTMNQINRSYLRESISLKKKHKMPSGKESRCIDCGKKISKYAFRCMKCNAKVQTGREKAKVTGKYGGAFGKRKRRKNIKTNIGKKAHTPSIVYFLILLTILIIAYILALPPEFRQLLLN